MDEITQIRLGQKVRKLREIKGFKQESLAREIGITLNAYGKLERGETKITVDYNTP
jgi:transcriptional regulator with XRE-family HTH domain